MTDEPKKRGGLKWLLFVISFPLITIILGVIMIVLAYSTPDTQIESGWYKKGLGIYKTDTLKQPKEALDSNNNPGE